MTRRNKRKRRISHRYLYDRHQDLVYYVRDWMKAHGYTNIHTNMDYKVRKNGVLYEGEVDNLGLKQKGHLERILFAEIKGRHSWRQYRKAVKQYHRFEEAYQLPNLRGVYVARRRNNTLVTKLLPSNNL